MAYMGIQLKHCYAAPQTCDLWQIITKYMMTSSNGNICRIIGHSPHNGQWRGASMFSLICVWINGWVNNREAGDLRRNRAHYDVIVMIWDSNYIPLHLCVPDSTYLPPSHTLHTDMSFFWHSVQYFVVFLHVSKSNDNVHQPVFR